MPSGSDISHGNIAFYDPERKGIFIHNDQLKGSPFDVGDRFSVRKGKRELFAMTIEKDDTGNIFYDKKGNETSVVAAKDYTILSFTKPEHVNRHKNDKEPIPTAAWQFDQNSTLSEVDELLPIIPNPASYKASGQKVVFDERP